VRRALLLFAIVLGMAALAASLSRPPEQRTRTDPRAPAKPSTVSPGPAVAAPAYGPPETLALVAAADESGRLRAGRAATVSVAVDEAGTVEIPGLGLSASADRVTPARFDVLPMVAGTHEILFTPADGDVGEPAGRLVVRSAG
jgi:hypothetical protein